MAFRVVWSETASDDLRQIVQFIARDSQDAAARLAERVIAHIETASAMPWSNRIVPEKADASIREAILKPYRIIYLIEEDRGAIHVLRIWHAARGVPETE